MADEIKKPETPKVSGTERTNTKVTPAKTGNSLPPVTKQKPQPRPDPVREKIMAAGFAPKVNKEAGAKLNGKKIKPGSPNKDENTPVGVVKKPLESNKGVNKRVDKMFKETEQPTLGVWNHDKKDKLMAPADEIKFNPKYDKSEKANQVLEDRKKIMAAGFKPNSKSNDLSDLDIDAQRWLGRGDIYDFEVERPSNDNFTYIKRKNLMDDSEEKFNYDRNTGKLTYLDGSGYTDIDYKGNPDAEYHSSEQIREKLDNLNPNEKSDSNDDDPAAPWLKAGYDEEMYELPIDIDLNKLYNPREFDDDVIRDDTPFDNALNSEKFEISEDDMLDYLRSIGVQLTDDDIEMFRDNGVLPKRIVEGYEQYLEPEYIAEFLKERREKEIKDRVGEVWERTSEGEDDLYRRSREIPAQQPKDYETVLTSMGIQPESTPWKYGGEGGEDVWTDVDKQTDNETYNAIQTAINNTGNKIELRRLYSDGYASGIYPYYFIEEKDENGFVHFKHNISANVNPDGTISLEALPEKTGQKGKTIAKGLTPEQMVEFFNKLEEQEERKQASKLYRTDLSKKKQ